MCECVSAALCYQLLVSSSADAGLLPVTVDSCRPTLAALLIIRRALSGCNGLLNACVVRKVQLCGLQTFGKSLESVNKT